jgi:FAD synthase
MKKYNIITGKVIKGNGDGTALGFPTANLDISSKIDIETGVYACIVNHNDKQYKAVFHYGPRAVFGETELLFEVHILDFKEKIYDEEVSVLPVAKLRDTQNFFYLENMLKQIGIDCEEARKVLEDKEFNQK